MKIRCKRVIIQVKVFSKWKRFLFTRRQQMNETNYEFPRWRTVRNFREQRRKERWLLLHLLPLLITIMMMMMMIRKRERPAGQQRLTRGINTAACERVRPKIPWPTPMNPNRKADVIRNQSNFILISSYKLQWIHINKNRLLIIDFHSAAGSVHLNVWAGCN